MSAVLNNGLPTVEAACLGAVRGNIDSSHTIITVLVRRRGAAVAFTIMTPEAV